MVSGQAVSGVVFLRRLVCVIVLHVAAGQNASGIPVYPSEHPTKAKHLAIP